ncbi:hypothetical protein [Ornithinimicrobium kibberense]|uniref:hypothetical protein n=1 Tax=Ornithinimicrobium kibberense TaxID=282060 RepID=UPI00360CCC66
MHLGHAGQLAADLDEVQVGVALVGQGAEDPGHRAVGRLGPAVLEREGGVVGGGGRAVGRVGGGGAAPRQGHGEGEGQGERGQRGAADGGHEVLLGSGLGGRGSGHDDVGGALPSQERCGTAAGAGQTPTTAGRRGRTGTRTVPVSISRPHQDVASRQSAAAAAHRTTTVTEARRCSRSIQVPP